MEKYESRLLTRSKLTLYFRKMNSLRIAGGSAYI